MRYPKFLPENGTMGFVAPSFGCSTEPYHSAFLNGQKKWEEMGYRFDFGPNCYAGEGVGISNTPELCAKELMDYYCSEQNDCLISCGGGELMCEVLSHMDFAKIKAAEPKWYMGYSDNTNFTYLLATLCDTASVYGPCGANFGMEPWHESLEDAMGILTGKGCRKEELNRSAQEQEGLPHWCTEVRTYGTWEKESLKTEATPLVPYNLTEKTVIRSFLGSREITGKGIPVTFQGRLLGGCMDILVNLLGTRFDRTTEFIEKYKEDGIIWFLEACDLNVFSIRRAMWQMEEAGWFRYVKGFLIGRPYCFGEEMMGLDQYQAVLKVAGEKNVPVIMDVDIGHLAPRMPIVVGSMGEVTLQNDGVQEGDNLSLKMHFI